MGKTYKDSREYKDIPIKKKDKPRRDKRTEEDFYFYRLKLRDKPNPSLSRLSDELGIIY